MLKVFLKPFIFLVPALFVFLQGVATIIDGNSFELVKKYPYYFAGYIALVYAYLFYKEFKQKKLEDKNEEANKEIERLKANKLELQNFDITDIPTMMGLINKFPDGEWHVARKLASKISTEYHEQVDMNLLYKALEELGDKGYIEIDHQLGGAISFKRK
jgi:hypothetical protein